MRKDRNVANVLFWLGVAFIAFGLSEAKSAEPGEHTISWTAPTKRVDGTALKPAEIVGYDIRYGAEPAATAWKMIKTVGATENKFPIILTEPGKYCFHARTIAKATSTTTVKSAWSNQACIDIEKVLVAPNPPTVEIQTNIKVTP